MITIYEVVMAVRTLKRIMVIFMTNTNLEKSVQAFDADLGTRKEARSITLYVQLVSTIG